MNLVAIIRLLRPHHWVKNALLFIPLVAAHAYLDVEAWKLLLVAFVAMSLVSSGVYVFNDLVDAKADKQNNYKRNRPLAAGIISFRMAGIVGTACLVLGLLLSLFNEPGVTYLLLFYVFLNGAYSLRLKRVVILDVLCLTSFYIIRIWIGSSATGIPISEWLIAFSMFLFLSLAFVKRYVELDNAMSAGHGEISGRSYRSDDASMLRYFGISAAYLAILVLALYIHDEQSQKLYDNHLVLWLLCPTMLYWISRIWMLANRRELHEDPILYALHDRVSYVVLGVIAFIVLYALPRFG